MPVVPPYYLSKIWCLWSPLTIWAKFDDCGPPLPVAVTRTQGCSLMIWCHKNARLYIAFTKTQNLMPVVPPYHLSKIWCLWSPLTIWAKFHACGPPWPFKQNLMPVVPPPYHLVSQERKAVDLWFCVTKTQGYSLKISCNKNAKFDACGAPIPFEQNLMPVVPAYHLSKIWCLWSPLTIWAKFDACGPPLPVGVKRTQGCSLMIWCHKNAKFDAYGPPLAFDYIWCLWSPLSIWPKCDACGPPYRLNKFDACGPPLPFDQNLMPLVPP